MPITFSQYLHKRKNSGLIPHWKMSVRYRGLKPVLCIQKLGHFGYTPLLVSLKHFPLSPCVCSLSYTSYLVSNLRNEQA